MLYSYQGYLPLLIRSKHSTGFPLSVYGRRILLCSCPTSGLTLPSPSLQALSPYQSFSPHFGSNVFPGSLTFPRALPKGRSLSLSRETHFCPSETANLPNFPPLAFFRQRLVKPPDLVINELPHHPGSFFTTSLFSYSFFYVFPASYFSRSENLFKVPPKFPRNVFSF